jgi:hypothetical protein
MRETAALRRLWGAGRVRERRHHHAGQRGLDGVGASETDRGRGLNAVMKQPSSVTCDGARPGTASPTMQGSETSMAWARAMDDNYGGGDDNYPNAVVEMGAEGREEGRGRDRQK